MTDGNHDDIILRSARPGEGALMLEITRTSVEALASGHYPPEVIADWMGDRTADYYEGPIAEGGVTFAERNGRVLGFVDAEPGEVTRLFLRPDAAGQGLGARLLAAGLAVARRGHCGPVRLESTLNAEAFYSRNGFRRIAVGEYSHGGAATPIPVVHMLHPG